jgi:ankyrin repeat protein
MCHKLLTVGTDPAITNNTQYTALHSFMRMKVAPSDEIDYSEVFALILEKSSIGDELLHAKNNLGQTPLHIAVFTQNLLGLSLLLDSKANPNLATEYVNSWCMSSST